MSYKFNNRLLLPLPSQMIEFAKLWRYPCTTDPPNFFTTSEGLLHLCLFFSFKGGRGGGLIQPDRDDLRYPGGLHGDSIKGVRRLHRLLVVGDENELRGFRKLLDQLDESIDVRII
jgi:hypothetical protein